MPKPVHRRLTRNVLWLLAERSVQTVAGIAVAAMLARALGAEGFAYFQYAQSLVLIAASVGLICGAEVAVPRLVALSSTTSQHHLLRHVFLLRMGAALLAYALLMVALFTITHEPVVRFAGAILGLAILLREPFGTIIAWLQAHTDNRPVALVGMAALLFKLVTVGLLFAMQVRAVGAYAIVLAIEAALAAALLVCVYRRRMRPDSTLPGPFDTALARALLRDGAMFWLAMMLMMTARRVDQLLLKPQVPLAELGAYAASMQLLDNVLLLATITVNALAPMLVYAQPRLHGAVRRIGRLATGMALLGIAGGIVLAVAAPWIVALLYGPGFDSTASLLRISTIGTGMVFADVALTLLAVYLRRPHWIVLKWLLVLLVTVAVDTLLIPRLGTHGAAIGFVCANAVAVVFGLALLLRAQRMQDQPR